MISQDDLNGLQGEDNRKSSNHMNFRLNIDHNHQAQSQITSLKKFDKAYGYNSSSFSISEALAASTKVQDKHKLLGINEEDEWASRQRKPSGAHRDDFEVVQECFRTN